MVLFQATTTPPSLVISVSTEQEDQEVSLSMDSWLNTLLNCYLSHSLRFGPLPTFPSTKLVARESASCNLGGVSVAQAKKQDI